VKGAHLTTYILTGPETAKAAIALKGLPGVDQVAPFGTSLHVVGRDAGKVKSAVNDVCKRHAVTAAKGLTNLEDVFIQFMAESRDNMR